MRVYEWTRVPLEREEGQDGAEYGLIVGFVAIVILVGVAALGQNLETFWSNITATLGGYL